MKNYEIKSVGPASVFKLYFVLGLILGLILSLVLVLVGVSLNSIGLQLGTTSLHNIGLLQVGAVILGIILASLAYGLLLGIVAWIGAVIYNAFAALVGGITVKISERD